jgi:hypothetical protein
MLQQGQVLRLKSTGSNGEALWAYRYRNGGRDSKRVQRGVSGPSETHAKRSSESSRCCAEWTGLETR